MTTDLEVKKATSDQLDEMLEIDLTPPWNVQRMSIRDFAGTLRRMFMID